MKASRFLRTRAILPAAALVGGAGLLVTQLSGSAPASETPQIQSFHLRAAHSGKDATVAGGSLADGARVIQLPATALNDQGFVPLPFGSAFVIVNANSNKVLDIDGGSTASGAAVVQHTFGPSAAEAQSQVWFLTSSGTGAVFTNFKSGLAMEVAGASTSDGAPLIQSPKNGAADQTFTGIPVGVPATTSSSSSTSSTSTSSTSTTSTTMAG